MKCGYCGKDFAESQHHYCPEGQRFLLAELSRLRAENVAKDAEIERLKAILADALEWGMTSKHFDAGRSLKNGEDARAALFRAEQAGPVPQREAPGISERYRQQVYDLCNRRLRGELTDDEWDAEVTRLEGMK